MIFLLLTNGIGLYGLKINTLIQNFDLEVLCYDLLVLYKHIFPNFRRDGLDFIWFSIVYLITV